MKNIRLFLYLDEYKMYSIHSQMAGGLTDYVMKHSYDDTTDSVQQKGPMSSGRAFENVLNRQEGIQEKRFLHDYSYTLFEQKLTELGKVNEISLHTTAYEDLDNISENSFVKISGQATFNDAEIILHTLKSINNIQRAFNDLSGAKVSSTPKPSKQNREPILDKKYIENLVTIIKFGYKGQFQLQIPITVGYGRKEQDLIFSSIMKRELLLEKEEMIIQKYSRNSEIIFTLFGMITQSGRRQKSQQVQTTDRGGETGLKQAMMNVNTQLSKLEETYTGRLDNEVIVDPIALYREV